MEDFIAFRTKLENDMSRTDLIRLVEQLHLWLTEVPTSNPYELSARKNAALKLEELVEQS